MKERFSLSKLSLRLKLVLSYLAVALGAILILTIAVALAVQNYFTTTQLTALRHQAQYRAQQIEIFYARDKFGKIAPNDPVLLAIADATGAQVRCYQPAFLVGGNCNDPIVKNALADAFHHNKEISGPLQVSTQDNTFSSLFISIPLISDQHIRGDVGLL